jgi:hypothetical protein
MVKTQATDGYDAVQVGYKVVPERKVRKPELGHLQKAGCPPMKHLREFKVRARARRGAPAIGRCAAVDSAAPLPRVWLRQGRRSFGPRLPGVPGVQRAPRAQPPGRRSSRSGGAPRRRPSRSGP